MLLRSIDLMEEDADKAVSWNRLADVYQALDDHDNAAAAYQMADKLTTSEPGVRVDAARATAETAETATHGKAPITGEMAFTSGEIAAWSVQPGIHGREGGPRCWKRSARGKFGGR